MRVYQLSSQNRLYGLSSNWDDFAARNGGESAREAAVQGRVIWDFVVGVDTRSYLNALFFACRRSQTRVAVQYRCDSPLERRLIQMQIDPLPDQSLRVSHAPLEVLTSPRQTTMAQDLVCCGQCLRCRRQDQWEDVIPLVPPVDFVVCPHCRAEARRAIERSMSLRPAH